jgi:hypothetical protein
LFFLGVDVLSSEVYIFKFEVDLDIDVFEKFKSLAVKVIEFDDGRKVVLVGKHWGMVLMRNTALRQVDEFFCSDCGEKKLLKILDEKLREPKVADFLDKCEDVELSLRRYGLEWMCMWTEYVGEVAVVVNKETVEDDEVREILRLAKLTTRTKREVITITYPQT